MIEVFTHSQEETKKISALLAKELLKEPLQKNAVVLALEGDLGGGKTTFLQGFARGLGIRKQVLSPTFVIAQKFAIRSTRFKNFYHLDCYRVDHPRELLGIGFKEVLAENTNIVAIEWSSRIAPLLPKDAIKITFDFVDENTRKLSFSF